MLALLRAHTLTRDGRHNFFIRRASRAPRLAIGGYFASRLVARLLGAVDLRDLDAHDPLIGVRGDWKRERFVDTHDRRDVGGPKPSREIGDRLKVEDAVFVVDHAVVEAGGLEVIATIRSGRAEMVYATPID